MLNNIYQAVKSRLNTTGKPVEWYNAQYDAVMLNEEGVFVEFPEKMNFAADSKQLRRAPVTVRLHVYTKALMDNDGITDAQVESHETLALSCKALMDGYTPADNSCSRLTFYAWQHWHRYNGWMVTFVEFTAKVTLAAAEPESR